MALKYYISYYGAEADVFHECEIDVPDYVGDVQNVRGYVVYEHPEVEDVLEAIRGSKITINLEANQGLQFAELYTEEERINKATYKRNGEVLFVGFIKPDGFYRDFVNNEWLISLEATDGLGMLKNLSYDRLTGGFVSEISVMAVALQRTGLNLDICTNLNVSYDTQDAGTDVLANVKVNQNRFVKIDSVTGMDCEAVIRSVLEKYGASVFQYKGQWVVLFLPNKTDLPELFYNYDYQGNYIDKKSILSGSVIGSDVNGFEYFHCNEDQGIETAASIGASRINFKYGFLASMNDNAWMINDGSVIGGWDVINSLRAKLNGDNTVDILYEAGTPNVGTALISNPTFTLLAGQTMQLKSVMAALNGVSYDPSTELPSRAFEAEIIATGATKSWYLEGSISSQSSTLEWIEIVNSTVGSIGGYFSKEGVYYTFEKNIPELTEDVEIEIRIDQLQAQTPENDPPRAIRLNYFGLSVAASDEEEVEGEFHTFQRVSRPSSVIKDVREISVGDVSGDIYSGALYKSDGETLTTDWKIGEELVGGIIQVMGRRVMSTSQKPAQIFSGSVFGFLHYPGPLSIDGVPGNFIMKSQKYDTKSGICKILSHEVFNEDISADLSYSKYLDYGDNKVEPTIN